MITVSESARDQVMHLLAQDGKGPDAFVRVGVKGGGCSGFTYLLDLTEVQKETDEEWAFTYTRRSKGAEGGGVATAEAPAFTVKVICDPKSYLYLNGTTIDFKDELMGRGFVFNNPNSTSTCGCGSSFSA